MALKIILAGIALALPFFSYYLYKGDTLFERF